MPNETTGSTFVIITFSRKSGDGVGKIISNRFHRINILWKLYELSFHSNRWVEITPEELKDSGWLSLLDARPKVSDQPTSNTCSPNRRIYIALFSTSIQYIVIQLEAYLNIPWKPHYGFILKHQQHPNSTQVEPFRNRVPSLLTMFIQIFSNDRLRKTSSMEENEQKNESCCFDAKSLHWNCDLRITISRSKW